MAAKEAHRRFIAEVTSPEPRRFYLSHTGIQKSSFGSFDGLGWELVVNALSPAGDERPFRDHWAETLLEILRYPEDYTEQALHWRWASSSELADLRTLQPEFDASRRFETAIKTALSPDGEQRLCINLYDDRRYRFTLEQLISHGGLSVWVPRDWSNDCEDLPSIEDAARRAFRWFQ